MLQKLDGQITGQAGSLKTFIETNVTLFTNFGWEVTFPVSPANSVIMKQGTYNNRTRAIFYIDDSTTIESRIAMGDNIVGGNLMTNLVNRSPRESQVAGGLFLRKSNTSDATLRNISIIFNNRSMYFLIQDGKSTDTFFVSFFGDYIPIGETKYTQILISNAVTNTTSVLFNNVSTSIAVNSGHYMLNDPVGLNQSLQIGKSIDYIKSNVVNIMGAGGMAYPNPLNNKPFFSSCDIFTVTPSINYYGKLPGIIVPLHNKPFGNLDTFIIGTKTYLVVNIYATGQACFEISDTWEI